MHAVVITEPGGPDVLRWTEVPDPEPGPGEVLIKVAASAVNRADLMQRQGHYPPPKGAPPYPGLECSGTVATVGEGVTAWQPGDKVCALLAGGGYAEKVAVSAGQLLPAPKSTTLIEAAALPETVCTVYSNVFLGARLAKGETLLIHGGGSGIGTTAIQLGKHAGAIVAVTAGSQEKLDACRQLGADILINYEEDDFAEKLLELTGGHGADVILDIIGAAASGRLFGGGDEVLGLVVDGEIGTERDACRTFFRRSGCRHDTGAERLGELDRGRADAGRPAVDQQCFSGSKATALENVVPDREEGFGDGRRLDQRQICGTGSA